MVRGIGCGTELASTAHGLKTDKAAGGMWVDDGAAQEAAKDFYFMYCFPRQDYLFFVAPIS